MGGYGAAWLGFKHPGLFRAGDIRLFAFITEPGPIRKILEALGEPLEPPPVSPARGPPTDWGELVQAHDDRNVFQASCVKSRTTCGSSSRRRSWNRGSV